MLSKGNVLVVDDEINLCRILSAKLAKDGYDVVTVHDGEQAVEKVKESHFDVVLLDLILPKMDGLTALSHIKSMNSSLPVIIMTACENSEAIEQAVTRGVTAYVNKPFDLDNVVALVRSASQNDDHPHLAQKRAADTTILFVRSQPVTLEVFNGSASGHYDSRIEDKDDRTITVLTPSKDGDALTLAPRTLIRVGLPSRDAFYSFSSSTLSQRLGNPSVTVLDKPNVIYRVQRRQFARILARVPLKYCAVSDQFASGGSQLDAAAWKTGESQDISAGGARIAVGEDLPPETMIYLETEPISEFGAVSVMGKVVRNSKRDDDSGFQHTLGVRFTSVNNSLRNIS